MDNKRAIEVLQLMLKGSTGYTAVEREDAIDAACAALEICEEQRVAGSEEAHAIAALTWLLSTEEQP